MLWPALKPDRNFSKRLVIDAKENRCMKTTLYTTFIKNGSLKVRGGVGVIDSEALNRSLGFE